MNESPVFENTPLDVTLALMRGIQAQFPSVPYLQGGNRIDKPVKVAQISRWDLIKNPFGHINKAQLPSITVSLADMTPSTGVYVDRTPRETVAEVEGVTWGFIEPPREQMDLSFVLYFNADNSTVINYFIGKTVPAFKHELAYLEVIHRGRQDEEPGCYELDVTTWPVGSETVANLDNLYEARLELVIRGVEFVVGAPRKVPLIRSFSIPVTRMDQTVTATVNAQGEVIITIV